MVGESWLLITLILLIVSLITQQTPLLLVTLLVFLTGLLIRIWSRYALAGVIHEHELSNEYAFFGDVVSVEVSVTNRKILPLPVVEIGLEAPEELKVLHGSVIPAAGDAIRVNLFSLFSMGWYRKVTRRYQIECSKRGHYMFGPSFMTVRDPFGFTTREAERYEKDRLLVYPRILSLKELGLPSTEIIGERRIRRQLFEDPLRIVSRQKSALVPRHLIRSKCWCGTSPVIGTRPSKRRPGTHCRSWTLGVIRNTAFGSTIIPTTTQL